MRARQGGGQLPPHTLQIGAKAYTQMSKRIMPQTKRRLWEKECRNKSGVGGEEERPSQLEQTQQPSPPWLTPPLHAFFTQPAFSFAGPLPQTAALVTQQADHWIGCSRHATGTLSLTARSHSHLPLNPLGLAGAAQSSQQMRRTIRAKGFLICPQLAAKHRAAHLCLH